MNNLAISICICEKFAPLEHGPCKKSEKESLSQCVPLTRTINDSHSNLADARRKVQRPAHVIAGSRMKTSPTAHVSPHLSHPILLHITVCLFRSSRPPPFSSLLRYRRLRYRLREY